MAYVPRGLYYEDMEVGLKVVTAGRTISAADIMTFAGISGDWNAIHVESEFAKTSAFGERVAHGLLGLSVATGLAMQMGFLDRTVEAFTSMEWKFRAPIKIGDTIHTEAEVTQKKAVGTAGGFVTFNVVVKNQNDQTTQRGSWTIMVKSKPKSDE